VKRLSAAIAVFLLLQGIALAEDVIEPIPDEADVSRYEQCLLEAIRRAPPDAAVSALQQLCDPSLQTQRQRNEHALRGRLALEEVSRLNPFVLTPHRRNYLLPISYWSNPVSNNPQVENGELQRQEAKFQISLKAPLVSDFWNGYTLYFSLTSTSWWQLYNQDLSRPFRETNYEPELFMVRTVDWQFGPVDSELLSFGYWHHSNGRDVPVSRSWDRLFISYVFRTGSWYGTIKPWWRIPENTRRDANDPKRDDNPDIERYFGHFDFTVIKPMGNHVLELMLRNNLRQSENRGSAQLEYSFPINRRFKGFFQAFTGYGDSLINYNNYQNRVSLGVLLTDTF
jgi:phospholipase A1/A2